MLENILNTIIKAVCLVLYIIFTYLEAAVYLVLSKHLKSLSDEIILITGSGNGIGKEVCFQLAKSNAKLVCWDIDKKSNDKVVKDLIKQGVLAYGYTLNIGDRSQVEAIAEKVIKEVGHVSIIIQNAGIAPCHEFLNCSSQLMEDVFKVNVLSQFWILRQFLPNMIKVSKGQIVTVCSLSGIKFNRYMVPYHGSKAAIHGYIESLKNEIRHHPERPDIKFSTVYPTAVNTKLMDNVLCEFRFPTLTPILQPEYVAKRLIEGLRREEEYIYCPSSIPLFLFLEQLIPRKGREALMDFLMPTFEPKQLLKDDANLN